MEIKPNGKFQTFQGDVDFFSINEIPKSTKLLKTKTVMHGEATGHHHTFKGSSKQVLIYEPIEEHTIKALDGQQVPIQKFVNVLEDVKITHQEHDVKTGGQLIPKGLYAIPQEREYDVFERQIRRVVD